MVHILKSFAFIVTVGGFFILCLVRQPLAFIQSERRPPADFPEINPDDIASGEFMEDFDRAAADHFPFRENFRTLRAAAVFGLFMQTDKNGLYMDEYGVGEITPLEEESVEQVSEKINVLVKELAGMDIYYSFIPDKSYYAKKRLPGFDPAIARKLFAPAGQFIDITNVLDAGCYYRTDLHWNQVRLGGVANTLTDSMLNGAIPDVIVFGNASASHAGEFEGVYSGQMALPVGSDGMDYIENPNLEAWYLNSQATGFEQGPVYDREKLTGIDPYDFFLRGAQPLVTIKNKAPAVDRDLFIFRDSFSSSLAPLLAGIYRQVTLIDLRYIDITTLRNLVDFIPGSDVLFLYSSQILNHAEILR